VAAGNNEEGAMAIASISPQKLAQYFPVQIGIRRESSCLEDAQKQSQPD
jgi:hypothetical protein